MKRFESFLAPQLEDYMNYRRQLGYDTQSLCWALKTPMLTKADPSTLK